jgi:hypothetical protein
MIRRVSLDDIKIAYNELRKVHNKLPTFEALDAKFELIRIDFPEMILREVRRLIVHHFQSFARDLELIIHPNPGIPYSLVEASAYSEEEKHKIYAFYKKHWYYIHAGQIAGLSADDKEQVKFILDAYKVWPKFREEHRKLLKIAQKEWQKKIVKDTGGNSYVG